MLLLAQSTCQPLLPVLAAPLVLNPSKEVSCNVYSVSQILVAKDEQMCRQCPVVRLYLSRGQPLLE